MYISKFKRCNKYKLFEFVFKHIYFNCKRRNAYMNRWWQFKCYLSDLAYNEGKLLKIALPGIRNVSLTVAQYVNECSLGTVVCANNATLIYRP